MTPAGLLEPPTDAELKRWQQLRRLISPGPNAVREIVRTAYPALMDHVTRLAAAIEAKDAEVEAKQTKINQLHAIMRNVDDQADEARADVERLGSVIDSVWAELRTPQGGHVVRHVAAMREERDAARAEVERLKTEVLGWITSVNELAELAGAEPGDNNVEVIRAALEER